MIGIILKFGRELRGYTQIQLAQMSGVTQFKISRLEKGISELRVSELQKLCTALDIPLEMVFRLLEWWKNQAPNLNTKNDHEYMEEFLKSYINLRAAVKANKGVKID